MSKRAADLVIGSMAMLITLPIWLLCAVIIKLSSSGPVLYKQTRVGLFGLPFQMYKFRTMYPDAEKHTGPIWASDNDPRIVPACRWMRLSHIDELPQLINVLKGDMSLVGPRPERLEIMLDIDVEDRVKIVKRLDFKPGITGLAQIRGGYDVDLHSFRRKLESDLEYIDNHNFWIDLWIMLRTIPKVRDKASR